MTLERRILQVVAIALSFCCLMGLLAYIQTKNLTGELLQRRENIRLAQVQLMRTQLHFKTQVQELKNILLRGRNPADYREAFRQFEIAEQKTQISIVRFIDMLHPKSNSVFIANQFLDAHTDLAKQYREGLAFYSQLDEKSSFFTDNLVRGIHLGPSQLIDELATILQREGDQIIGDMHEECVQLEMVIFGTVVAILIFAGVCFYLAVNRWVTLPVRSVINFSNRIADGDFSKPLPIESTGDLGQLALALNKMQNALASSYDKLISTNSALKAARDDALAATQAKSEFLANMSHEIRTPLNGVIGLTDLLFKSKLNREQMGIVELLRGSGASLLSLVNDILDISKIEKGVLPLNQQEFSPLEVVENAIKIVADKAEERGLDCAFCFDSAIPTLLVGDPLRVEQILVNLMNNAIKFTQNGGFYVHIKAQQKDEYKVLVRFNVVDTGIGIKRYKLNEIFERFHQVDASSSRSQGGAGLGLFISKQLAEAMGGDLTANSRFGEGSDFCAELLLERSIDTRFYLPKIDSLDNKHVVFICDRKFQNESTKCLLRKNTASLKICRNTDELKALQQQVDKVPVPDYIFIDSRVIRSIPAKDMSAAICMIGKNKSGLIWVTAAGDEFNMEEFALRSKFCAKLHRPLLPSTANQTMEGLLHNRSISLTRTLEPAASGELNAVFLVAEDNKVNQIIIEKILESEGCRCVLAENGKQAVEMALQRDFDCILMDCQMPIMDGYKATAEIRAKEQKYNYIVALTAHAMEGDREKCLAAGMNDYMTKPIRADDFATVIKKLSLHQRRYNNVLQAL